MTPGQLERLALLKEETLHVLDDINTMLQAGSINIARKSLQVNLGNLAAAVNIMQDKEDISFNYVRKLATERMQQLLAGHEAKKKLSSDIPKVSLFDD